MTKQFLVSGAASGFGKYLCEKINAIGLTRSNSVEVIENLSQNYENNKKASDAGKKVTD